MSEITPEEGEAIVDAAARGEVTDLHPSIGSTLADLHTPVGSAALGVAPTLATAGGDGRTRRIARRSAVAASAALLGVTGVAAAATGGFDLLDPRSEPPAVVETVVVPAAVATDQDGSAGDDAEPAAAGEGEEAPEGAVEDPPPEVEGVDPSDGLDADELELLCAAVTEHGEYVSAVARDRKTESDDAHGTRVNESAASDCGKEDAGAEDDGDASGEGTTPGADVSDAGDPDESDAEERGGRGQGKGREDAPGQSDNPGNGDDRGHDDNPGKGHDDDR